MTAGRESKGGREGDRASRRGSGVMGLDIGLALLLMVHAPAPSPGHEVSVTTDNARGECRVLGEFHAPVSDSIVWKVLSDYEHIPRFVRSVRSSELRHGEDGRLLLSQEAVGGIFFMRRRVRVVLEIRELTGRRIGFRDVSGEDFRRYVGEWRLTPDSSGTRVEYELAAEPRVAIPRMVCRSMLRRTAQDLLEQVRVEILRRAGPSGTHEAF